MPCPRAAGCNLCYAREDSLPCRVEVNPAQPPSVSRCAPRSRSPVSLIVLPRSCSCRWGPCVLLPPLVWRVRSLSYLSRV